MGYQITTHSCTAALLFSQLASGLTIWSWEAANRNRRREGETLSLLPEMAGNKAG